MEIIAVTDPKNVLAALNEHQKIAVFAVDDNKKPLFFVSDIKIRVSQISDKTEDIVFPALRYIQNNYNKDIKLAHLADLCDISPSYFSRLFSKSTGKNISQYVIDVRLEHAAELLLSTPRSVVAIACEVGYVDCGYFYKLFRKKYGCTPIEYRRAALTV